MRSTQATFLKVVAGTTASSPDPDDELFRQHDPALRAVDTHRQAAKIFTQAVRVEFASEGHVTRAALARLNETTREATDDVFAAGCYSARGLTLDRRPSRTPVHARQRVVSTN
jgi:hypothetical protein